MFKSSYTSFRWGTNRTHSSRSNDLFEPEYYVYQANVVGREEIDHRERSSASRRFDVEKHDDCILSGDNDDGLAFFDDEVLVGVRRRPLQPPEMDAEYAHCLSPKRRRVDRGYGNDSEEYADQHIDIFPYARNNPYAANIENGEVLSRVLERPRKRNQLKKLKGIKYILFVLACIGATLTALYFSGVFDSAAVPDINNPSDVVNQGPQYDPSIVPSPRPSYADSDIGMVPIVAQGFVRYNTPNILDSADVTAFEDVIEIWLDADSLELSDPNTLTFCEVLIQNVALNETYDRKMNESILSILTVTYSVSWASRFGIEVDMKERVEAYITNSTSIDALYELLLQANIFIVEGGVGTGLVSESLPSISPMQNEFPSYTPSESLRPTNMVTLTGEGNLWVILFNLSYRNACTGMKNKHL